MRHSNGRTGRDMATILTAGEVDSLNCGWLNWITLRDSHEALRADNADLLARFDAAGFGATIVNDELTALRARVAELTAEFEAEDAAHEDEIAGHQETILLLTNAKERIADLEKENAELRLERDRLKSWQNDNPRRMLT